MKQFRPSILLLMLCIMGQKLHAQDRPAISGYSWRHLFFDSLHKAHADELAAITGSYYFYVSFDIDECARISNYETVELPVARVPEKLKTYVQKLFSYSNGRWVVRAANDSFRASTKLVCLVTTGRNSETLQEKLNSGNEVWQYLIQGAELIDPNVLRCFLSENKMYLVLTY